MVEAFGGFEPQVGEIRALRTFRLGPGGALYPLFGSTAWVPGVNTARCRRAAVDPAVVEADHRPAEPDCSCGFYAYATPEDAAEYPHAAHVLAVVSCWGRVIAGTRGVRAEHARVEALWLSPTVPADLVASVAEANPGVRVFAERDLMLARHPVTVLDCYTPTDASTTRRRRAMWRAGVTAGVLVGLLPPGWLGPTAHTAAIAALVGVVAVLVAVLSRHTVADVASRRRLLLLVALALWLLAPLGGVIGTAVLRIPLVEVGLIGWLQRHHLRRSAAAFPARIT